MTEKYLGGIKNCIISLLAKRRKCEAEFVTLGIEKKTTILCLKIKNNY